MNRRFVQLLGRRRARSQQRSGFVDPHPGNDLLLESGDRLLLEQAVADSLLLEQ